MGGLDHLGRGIALGREFTVGAISNRGPGVLQKPGERYPVLVWQVQDRSGVGVQAARKIGGTAVRR